MILFKGKEITKERLLNMYTLFSMRQGRGSGIINQLRFQELFVLGGAAKILLPWLSNQMLLVIGVLYMISTYHLGVFDERYLKLWQFQNEKAQTHASPYFQRMERHLIRVQRELKIDMKGDDKYDHTGK